MNYIARVEVTEPSGNAEQLKADELTIGGVKERTHKGG